MADMSVPARVIFLPGVVQAFVVVCEAVIKLYAVIIDIVTSNYFSWFDL